MRICTASWLTVCSGGGRLYTFRDGRTPLQVAEARSIIPNQRRAPCSEELKVKPFRAWLYALPKPVTVLLGLDWQEQHRIDQRQRVHYAGDKPRLPIGYQARISGVYEDYPLLWRPYEWRPYADVVRSWGIEPPRLYAMGFPHNNCGGRCVKQGKREWLRLRLNFPERFAEVRDWEQAQRAKGGPRADYAIVRDFRGKQVRAMPLAELEREQLPANGEPFVDDMFACHCTF